MRHILRRRELVEDDWRYLGEDGAGAALIVPFAEFRTNIDRWRAYTGPLGVRLSPADEVESLAGDIHRLALIAAEFPGAGEGRGYSQARLLRARFQFKGELRAVGAGVKQDLLFIMSRCGFDSFDLAPGQKLDEAIRALDRYSVAYQPAEPVPAIKQQRYFSGSSVPSNS
jgi:uncharacterized protein (DUF934 family)